MPATPVIDERDPASPASADPCSACACCPPSVVTGGNCAVAGEEDGAGDEEPPGAGVCVDTGAGDVSLGGVGAPEEGVGVDCGDVDCAGGIEGAYPDCPPPHAASETTTTAAASARERFIYRFFPDGEEELAGFFMTCQAVMAY